VGCKLSRNPGMGIASDTCLRAVSKSNGTQQSYDHGLVGSPQRIVGWLDYPTQVA
jgi:hypothetical protein